MTTKKKVFFMTRSQRKTRSQRSCRSFPGVPQQLFLPVTGRILKKKAGDILQSPGQFFPTKNPGLSRAYFPGFLIREYAGIEIIADIF
jgi:hypothetical protein